MVLPIRDIVEDQGKYLRLLCGVVGGICIFYVLFGDYCVAAYGNQLDSNDPMITTQLPATSIVTQIVKIGFIINLLFTFPLQIVPANNVLESYLFGGMVKGKKRMWLKNLSRTFVVAIIIFTAIVMVNNIPLVIELVGALTCAPLAFTLPALFHYKACAVTKC